MVATVLLLGFITKLKGQVLTHFKLQDSPCILAKCQVLRLAAAQLVSPCHSRKRGCLLTLLLPVCQKIDKQ